MDTNIPSDESDANPALPPETSGELQGEVPGALDDLTEPVLAASEPQMPPHGNFRSSPPTATVRSESIEWIDVARYLFNHNPFYPISSILILLSLHNIFYDAESARNIGDINFRNGVLMAVLASFTTVLAIIASLIVRLGKVWDDARTILVSIVLLLVTMSINCDKPILEGGSNAPFYLLGGLVFSIGLSEVVLRVTRINLSWLARLPFYALLGLFFLYPIALNYFLNTIGNVNNTQGRLMTQVGILLFPAIAGLVSMTLLPAALCGPALVSRNVTPWKWPLHPWSLFVMLGVAVILRAYYFTVSFHARNGMESEFAVYLLTPFLLVVALLIFELGRSIDKRELQHIAMSTPILLIPLSLPSPDSFLPPDSLLALYQQLAAPIQVTLVGMALLWSYGALRRGPSWLYDMVPIPLILLAFTRQTTLSIYGFTLPAWQPIVVAFVILAIRAIVCRNSSWQWFATALCGVFCLSVAPGNTSFLVYGGVIPMHLLLAMTMLISLICNDNFTPVLRTIASLTMAVSASATAAYSLRVCDISAHSAILLYVAVLCLTSWTYWLLTRDQERFQVAWFMTSMVLFNSVTTSLIQVINSSNPEGFSLLLCGILSLVAGLVISTLKIRLSPPQPDRADLST